MGFVRLRMQHSSLQFSDSKKQQEHDIEWLFKKGIPYPVKTGTEAGPDKGPNANRALLEKYAKEFNHTLHFARDNWIAVDREIIKKGSVNKGEVFIVEADKTWGHGHDSVMATLSFIHTHPIVGRVSIGAVHYPVKGQNPGQPNWKWNKLYAEKIQQWMRKAGEGKDIAFVNGDFNMPDRYTDWSFGNDFTSMADELRSWENTGHGPIDGFCSYDKDKRVTAHNFSVLDDREAPLFTDHYVCRGVWEIATSKEEANG